MTQRIETWRDGLLISVDEIPSPPVDPKRERRSILLAKGNTRTKAETDELLDLVLDFIGGAT